MTTYKLKNSRELLNKKTTMQIVYILHSDKSKRGLTTKQIYKKGKEIFGNDFPENPITILRYLNTMLDSGKVEKYKKCWKLKDVEITMQKVLAKLDIDNLQRSIGYENQFYGILPFGIVTIYRASRYLNEFYKDEFAEIMKDIAENYRRIEELNSLAIIRKILASKYENDYLFYERYWAGKKNIKNLKFNKNLINTLRLIIIIYTMQKLQRELSDNKKLLEMLENLKKGGILKIELGGIKIEIPKTSEYNPGTWLSEKFFFLNLVTKVDEKAPSLLIEKDNTIRIHTSYLLSMAKIMKILFYKKRTEGKIMSELKDVKFAKEIYELFYGDMKDITEYMVPSVYYKHPASPIVVINPMKEERSKGDLSPLNQLFMDHSL